MHEFLSVITGRSRRSAEIFPVARFHSQLEQRRPIVLNCTEFVHCLFDFILVRRYHHVFIPASSSDLTKGELLVITSNGWLTANTIVSAIIEYDMLEVRRRSRGNARQHTHVHENGTIAIQTEDLQSTLLVFECSGRKDTTVRFGFCRAIPKAMEDA